MQGRATNTISTILVDDEELACDELSYLLREFPDIELIGTANNGLDALKLMEEGEPELVFLDVQMPGLDGLSVIRKHREKNPDVNLPYFILSTAFDQYALEAFRLEALDYILKPIEKERLALTVDRARRYIVEKAVPGPEQGAPGAPAAEAGLSAYQAAGEK